MLRLLFTVIPEILIKFPDNDYAVRVHLLLQSYTYTYCRQIADQGKVIWRQRFRSIILRQGSINNAWSREES